jgi:hypothetical protein
MVQVVGDACFPTTLAILVPGLWQEQIGIDQGLISTALWRTI